MIEVPVAEPKPILVVESHNEPLIVVEIAEPETVEVEMPSKDESEDEEEEPAKDMWEGNFWGSDSEGEDEEEEEVVEESESETEEEEEVEEVPVFKSHVRDSTPAFVEDPFMSSLNGVVEERLTPKKSIFEGDGTDWNPNFGTGSGFSIPGFGGSSGGSSGWGGNNGWGRSYGGYGGWGGGW